MMRDDELYRENQRVLDSIENRLHDPDPDLKVFCSLCDQEIPSDGYYYEINDHVYCQDCLDRYYRIDVDY